jgi:hypothetical protein
MKQKRFLGFLPAFSLLALPALVHAQAALVVGTGSGEFNEVVDIPITLQSDSDVQGVVVAVDWDASVATGVSITESAAVRDGSEAGADTVVTRIGDDFAVLGVVMDSNPEDNGGIGEVIPAGPDAVQIATLSLQCGSGPAEGSSAISFQDATYSAAEGGPTLDNVIVVGGLSIGATEGLTLDNGEISCTAAPDRFTIEATDIENTGSVRVLLNNNADVEGFVVSVCHGGAVLLDDILVGADATQADFSAVEIDPAVGGAIGVVIDLFDPMASPPNITPGQGQHIASFSYSCSPPLSTGADPVDAGVVFCDMTIGDPLKDNLIVVGGRSLTVADGLRLTANPVRCVAPTVEPPSRETDCDDGIDNDLDGLIDLDDPDCQTFDFEVISDGVIAAQIGDDTELVLSYNAPTEAALGIGGSGGDVLLGDSPQVSTQGFSLGFSFDCSQVAANSTFDIGGTILESLGAEFIGVQADNADDDGDGCSLVLAVLVDALPPFDGAVIPGLAQPQAMGSLSVRVLADVACGTSIVIRGEDGVNGLGKVPVRNLISVDNLPYVASVRPIALTAAKQPTFFRGDCNYTGRANGLDPVEIADAAAVISFLFQKSIFKFHPPCLDACDANDDGRIDLADAIGVLNYLFVPGANFPPDPGPGYDADLNFTDPGMDRTDDPLDCLGDGSC